ncbi:MAG: DUF86 domain-containing protein [Chitinophagaceae bacterium]|nr:DUF86 domain-containing protein [Chitinophagaceae bacterium]
MERDIHYFELILSSIEAIDEYLKNIKEDHFLNDRLIKDAVLMRLIVIGEYGAKVSERIKNDFKEIEWQVIKAARNFYVHVYDGVNWIYVWETVQKDLPALKVKIKNIIEQLDKNN